ncbi:MAG: cell division protein FtsW [Candidatus Nealsonbacteria bacterium RIFCSPLOWO2_01_FULL_43_36]|uniref:Probable peptidoglycan glycosyltransferase FtsW n=1 Tax=Candidatus Nealsonbacteria bacterium RIFCSPHIGHO2_02_FULL_43_13 TaxID=1801668 RepID=A0A1G2E8Z6_9BACT|nr:MAG: cell division protein FtsW [Candidatus Nealsonbacteria bacterium RIFCSPHIGHO2_02_FULL_43_13]OGZ25333.1 MAG: cell division protein FtsW [Candidatus Nealsonbacteria bacterium RIFCSPLOWO2_01_FULL_43_36]
MKRSDYFLIAAVACLVILGILIITSVTAAIAQQKFGSPTFYLLRHFIYGLLPGIILGFIAYKIPIIRFKKWIPLLLLGNLFLMVLVFVPGIGIKLGSARSWLNLGVTSFQPSELLKLVFILYLASWLATRAEKNKNEFSATLIAFIAIIGVIILLLSFQPDVGTLGIIIATGFLMYFLSGTPLKHTLLISFGGLVALAVLVKMKLYGVNRFLVLFNRDNDPMGTGYQIKQALIAVGSGGIFGTGLGMSVQKFGYLPEPMADSIFAVFAEETGLVGSLMIVALFLIITWLGFKIAQNAKNNFEKLTALGIVSWLSVQAFINIGAMLKILPLTGVPLPFLSYGGSALATELIGVGILLNISKHT